MKEFIFPLYGHSLGQLEKFLVLQGYMRGHHYDFKATGLTDYVKVRSLQSNGKFIRTELESWILINN